MYKIVLVTLFYVCLFGQIDKSYWQKNEIVELSKDEFFTIMLTIDGNVKKDLYFRWTLYKNESLTMHLGYDGFVHQFVLHPHYQVDSFKIPLYIKPNIPEPEPYFMIVLREFRLKDKKAVLEYFIRSGSSKIEANGKKIKNIEF